MSWVFPASSNLLCVLSCTEVKGSVGLIGRQMARMQVVYPMVPSALLSTGCLQVCFTERKAHRPGVDFRILEVYWCMKGPRMTPVTLQRLGTQVERFTCPTCSPWLVPQAFPEVTVSLSSAVNGDITGLEVSDCGGLSTPPPRPSDRPTSR